jgi:hypothetical protein
MALALNISCNDLNEQPFSSVTPADFGNSAIQIEAAYAASLNSLWDYWGGYGYAYAPFRNDDQLNDGDLNIGLDNGDDLWRVHYAAILNINTAIASIKNGNVQGETEETIDMLLAQGMFLRAHNYFMLVRMFGGVPLITDETPDPVSNPMPRASVADVYQLIVSDLTFAAENLPSSWAGAPGKPTKGAAKGILAKAYLTMATSPLNETSNYQKAADMAHEVIESGDYSLVTNIEDVFGQSNKYGPEMMWSYNSTYDDPATDPQIWTSEVYLDGGWGDAAMDTTFERHYPEQPRKDAYLFTDWNGLHYTDFPEQVPFCKKFFFYISEDDFNGYASTMNWPIIRYADVLLIYAEAANMANGAPTAEAVDAINQVIGRANGYVDNPLHPKMTTSMSKETFDEAVIQERNWELVYENADRWFDICRKRILDKVTARPDYLANFSVDDYLFPIPEIDLTLNDMLEQNPGY